MGKQWLRMVSIVLITPSISLCNFARMSEIPQQASFFETKTLGPQRHLWKMTGFHGTSSDWALDRQEAWHGGKNTGQAVRMGSSPDWQPPIVQVTSCCQASSVCVSNVTTSFTSALLQITSTSRLPCYLDQNVRTISCRVPAGLTLGQDVPCREEARINMAAEMDSHLLS